MLVGQESELFFPETSCMVLLYEALHCHVAIRTRQLDNCPRARARQTTSELCSTHAGQSRF